MSKQMLCVSIIVLAVFAVSLNGFARSTHDHHQVSPNNPTVQLAILLDTSNSMDGLINQAKAQLWNIVNELARARYHGHAADLEVALYEYGNDSLSIRNGYVRRVSALTTDLDKISEELFNLRTNGGSEYCGTVIQRAVRELHWLPGTRTLKLIYIAGNEPFTQGSIDYRRSCREAIEKGIIVNTIFCGNEREGIRTHWKDGADLADGRYLTIDQDKHIAHIDAPQDQELARLNAELNRTYIAYGTRGLEKKKRQEVQDSNAAGISSSVLAERAVTKASRQYKNESWDLVDAEKEGVVDIKDLPKSQLPKEMQGMSDKEKKKYLDSMRKKREELKAKIQKLQKERRAFITKHRSEQKGTLEQSIVSSVRDLAKKKEYDFSE